MKSVESPNRYGMHLPEGMQARTLEDAAVALAQRFGEPEHSTLDGLVELHHSIEDRDIWLYRRGGEFVGIRSSPKPKVQAFWRPCSGFAGLVTGTGSATGFGLFVPYLHALADARALAACTGFLAAACRICLPCVCVPIGPYPSAIRIAPAGFLRVTVTADRTANLLCV